MPLLQDTEHESVSKNIPMLCYIINTRTTLTPCFTLLLEVIEGKAGECIEHLNQWLQ